MISITTYSFKKTAWWGLLFSLSFICSLFLTSAVFAQQKQDFVLSMERIFFKPYLAGSEPTGAEMSPDGSIVLFQWDSTARGNYRRWLTHSDGSAMHIIGDTLLGEIQWSPDSKSIACTKKGDVFLTDTGFQSFRRITKTDAYEHSLHWSPDGRILEFSSDNKLLAMNIEKPEIVDIAAASSKDASIHFIDFTPDGKRAVFVEYDQEGQQEFVVPHYTGKDVTTRSFKSGVGKSKIGIAPVDTGATVWIKLPGDQPYSFGHISVAPDGKSILLERFSMSSKKREMFVADTDSGKARLIYEETDKAWIEGGLCSTRWMPDGKHILTTSEKDGWNHLYMMTPEGKDVRQLTDGEWEIHWFAIAPGGGKIFFQANKDDHHQWQLFTLDLNSNMVSKLSSREGSYEDPTLSKTGDFIVASYSDFSKPPELIRVPTSTSGTELQLTHSIPEAFKRIDWVIPDIIHFKSRDGKSVPAMIYKPHDFSPGKKYPVVVFVHGAGYLQNVYRGWTYYNREYMFHTRLTQLGYVVFEVDYRGSAGYGHDFRTDVYMHLGGRDLDDELDGIEYLKHLGYIDSDHVGIYGGSYGGFMVLMGLFLSDRYACGAALRAVTSWENYYRHSRWYTEPRLGRPEDNPEAYKISSPVTYADSLRKPLLILHGMVDDNVFFQDAVQLIAKLQRARKQFEVMVYPDESHSFHEPESWFDEYSRIEEFFNRHLKGFPAN